MVLTNSGVDSENQTRWCQQTPVLIAFAACSFVRQPSPLAHGRGCIFKHFIHKTLLKLRPSCGCNLLQASISRSTHRIYPYRRVFNPFKVNYKCKHFTDISFLPMFLKILAHSHLAFPSALRLLVEAWDRPMQATVRNECAT